MKLKLMTWASLLGLLFSIFRWWSEYRPYYKADQYYHGLREAYVEAVEDSEREQNGFWRNTEDGRETERNHENYSGKITGDKSEEGAQSGSRIQKIEDALVRRWKNIDFESLQSLNPDIVGWLWIPDTPVDYPVCCSPYKDTWYLNHLSNGEENKLGSLFLLRDNSLTDLHPMIFGHNMRSGEMFGSIKQYEKTSYQEAHVYACLYLPDRMLIFQFYGTGKVPVRDQAFRKVEKGEKELLEEMYLATRGTDPEKPCPDKILTLATCNGTEDTRRIVHFRLCREITGILRPSQQLASQTKNTLQKFKSAGCFCWHSFEGSCQWQVL